NARGTTLQFHFGVDRVLEPPFRAPGTAVFALRPILAAPEVFRLDEPFALPLGSSWQVRGGALVRLAAPPALPDLPIAGDLGDDGMVDLSRARLEEIADRSRPLVLRTLAGRPEAFRLTIFTATGYFCCLCADHGEGDADHGTIDLRTFF